MARYHTCTCCGPVLLVAPKHGVLWVGLPCSGVRAAHSGSQPKTHLNLAGVVPGCCGWAPQGWDCMGLWSPSCEILLYHGRSEKPRGSESAKTHTFFATKNFDRNGGPPPEPDHSWVGQSQLDFPNQGRGRYPAHEKDRICLPLRPRASGSAGSILSRTMLLQLPESVNEQTNKQTNIQSQRG